MAPHGKELSKDIKKISVALHKIAKTLKLSCSTVAKTIQRFNRTGFTQNRPRHGRPKKLSARAQRHIALWSDETNINLFGSDGVKRVWRHALFSHTVTLFPVTVVISHNCHITSYIAIVTLFLK